jgi:hypothetical protein
MARTRAHRIAKLGGAVALAATSFVVMSAEPASAGTIKVRNAGVAVANSGGKVVVGNKSVSVGNGTNTSTGTATVTTGSATASGNLSSTRARQRTFWR